MDQGVYSLVEMSPNVRNHEVWKQIFIRDQWAYDDLRREFKYDCYRAENNDTAQIACIGA